MTNSDVIGIDERWFLLDALEGNFEIAVVVERIENLILELVVIDGCKIEREIGFQYVCSVRFVRQSFGSSRGVTVSSVPLNHPRQR